MMYFFLFEPKEVEGLNKSGHNWNVESHNNSLKSPQNIYWSSLKSTINSDQQFLGYLALDKKP